MTDQRGACADDLATLDEVVTVLTSALAAFKGGHDPEPAGALSKAVAHVIDRLKELTTAGYLARGAVDEAAYAVHDLRISAMEADLARAAERASELEHSLIRTTELQRSLEAEFDHLRRQYSHAATALAAALEQQDALKTVLCEREAEIDRFKAEASRRGPTGSPLAVGRALIDLFRITKTRRESRLTEQVTEQESWRLPDRPQPKA